MGELIIANQVFNIDAPVVNWHQNGWDATAERCVQPSPPCSGPGAYGANAKNKSPRRYALRPMLRKYQKNPPLDATKASIKQFILHHDGCASAAMCWDVLHNERGLSCHFLIDNDGTIFQTIDLAYMAYHAAAFNTSSIGVEFCNRGDAKKEPAYYSRKGQQRDTKACEIHGHTYLAFDYTKGQYDAFKALAQALTRLLPNLPVEYPQDLPGHQAWGEIPNPMGFAGYMGHYHTTIRKWDPGPFDFKNFCEKLRGSLCFPMFPAKADPQPGTKPVIPKNDSELKAMASELFKANETKAAGGFFPVGPWGEHRLWHGGVHLPGREKGPVFAPFPGRIVAARMGKSSPIGSVNFVLMRHDMTIGAAHLRFFTLFMHLHDDLKAPDGPPPAWMTKEGFTAQVEQAKKGAVLLLDEPVEAGEIIGRVGKAGPPEISKHMIHLEIFSTTELFTEFDPNPWEVVDGFAGGRFCDVDRINNLIDANKNAKLSRDELSEFYASSPDVQLLKHMVTFHVSEWHESPDWADALRTPIDLRDLSATDIDIMVSEQVTPSLWWTDAVATHAKLTRDGAVYHYHPVTFLYWVNDQILQAAVLAPPEKIDASKAQETPPGVTDDLGDESGAEAVADTDLVEDDDSHLELEQLIQGYAGEDVEVTP